MTAVDLAVVGLGAMGSAALFHAAERGIRVLGIDRFAPPHRFGSSHAESRITRLAVGEGDQYIPFVARSHEIWRDLEARTGRTLLHQQGGYIITPANPTEDDRWGGFVHRTAAVAERAGIDFELRTHAEVNRHIPQIQLRGDEAIGFEPTGGIVMCERAVSTQLELAQTAGAEVALNTTVSSIEAEADHVRVVTDGHTYRAEKVIVATGAWFADLVAPVDAAAVAVTRQAVFWFEVDDRAAFGADRFPFVMWPGQTIAEYSAAFPMDPSGRPGLKLLGEQFHRETTPDTVDRNVTQAEIDDFYERLVAPRLQGVSRRVIDATVCLYTNTVDDHFLIDHHPDSDRILVASPCSGHGFKHSTALGEAMVAKMVGDSRGLSLDPFRRTRLHR